MSSNVSNVRLGLFVLAAIGLIVVTMVWMGANKYMKGATTYVSFFDESVQGLQVDSKVKYRGVDVGRVTDIRVAPDFKLIEVVMEIGFEGELSNEMVAQLQSVGITGIVFIEMNRQQPGDRENSPRVDFAAEYPIIPSKSSEMQKLMNVIDRVTKQLDRIDFEGMGDDVTETLAAVRNIVENASLQKSFSNLEKTASNLEAITSSLLQEIKTGRINSALNSIEHGSQNFDVLLAKARKALDEMKLQNTARQFREFVTTLKDQTLDIALLVRRTMSNLRSSSERLDRLLMRLERNPSDLIFSDPPAGR